MDTEYTEKTYGVDRFLLEGWFSIEEIEKLLVEMKGRVITPSLPAQRPWVGLTEEEVQFYIKKHSKLVNAGYDKMTDTNLVAKTFDSTGFYKEVSAVLKERNG